MLALSEQKLALFRHGGDPELSPPLVLRSVAGRIGRFEPVAPMGNLCAAHDEDERLI